MDYMKPFKSQLFKVLVIVHEPFVKWVTSQEGQKYVYVVLFPMLELPMINGILEQINRNNSLVLLLGGPKFHKRRQVCACFYFFLKNGLVFIRRTKMIDRSTDTHHRIQLTRTTRRRWPSQVTLVFLHCKWHQECLFGICKDC